MLNGNERPVGSVTVLLHGGLGNQLFQYAAAWALVGRERAHAIRVLSYGSEWGPEHPDLGSMLGIAIGYPDRVTRTRYPGVAVRESWKDVVSARLASVIGAITGSGVIRQVDPYASVADTVNHHQGPELSRARHVVLDGFFQHRDWWGTSWVWVAEALNARAPQIVSDLRKQHRIAMKVRRSDYVGRGIVLTDDYYRAALLALGVRDREVVVVTEDPSCRQSFEGLLAEVGCHATEPEPMTGNPNVDDFWQLAAAPIQVLANSSYCWWAAAAASVGNPDARAAYPVPRLPNAWSAGDVPDMGLPGWTSVAAEFT